MAEQDEVAGSHGMRTSPPASASLPGIRTATDLEDAFRPARAIADEAGRIARLERLLTRHADEPSVLRTLLATLISEPNLPYVRAWRSAEDHTRGGDDAGAVS